MQSSAPGEVRQLAQFEVIRRLGYGGMAEVFLAKKRGAGGTYKMLVVKRILPSHGASRRFQSMFLEEARLATRLNHPNVVQVYDFHDEGGDVGQLLSMEYVDGPDLGRLLSSAKRRGLLLTPWVGAWVISEAAKGLHYAHEKKDERGTPLDIVHRDVSPQNILLSNDGSVKLADFGIATARMYNEESGVLKGKYAYMSPEQARGEKLDRRSDIYALGVILWEILTGRSLHGGLGGEALLDIVRSGIVERPSEVCPTVPPDLEVIAMKALAPRADERYDTARDLSAAIGKALIARQEFVDASSLEAEIANLLPRSTDASGAQLSSLNDSIGATSGADQHTIAAAPRALSASGSARPAATGEHESLDLDSTHGSDSRAVPRTGREVRHVAVITLKLVGLEELLESDRPRFLERLRSLLATLAFKRRMAWEWVHDGEARAIAGLETNPTQAASDAAWLALDTHEALSGIAEDLPFSLAAAVAIVRGIASGSRDESGNLIRYRLHDPALLLSNLLVQQVPSRCTWVAGGVYRLVRREFHWGDAPSLNLDGVESTSQLPPEMRTYALVRGLAREEQVGDASSAPNDLVGRDLERADLREAFHAAVQGNNGLGSSTTRAIVGEMGIGKTALIATVLSELPPQTRLLRVEASPLRTKVPFGVLGDLLRDALGTTGEETLEVVAEILAKIGGGAASGDISNPVVARLAELATNRAAPAADPEDSGYQTRLIITGLRQLLAAMALQTPVVMVIDGLQWVDRASLDTLKAVLKSAEPVPLLTLLATRPDERVLAVLENQIRIDLRALRADDQVRLLEHRLGVRDGVREACAELLPRVGGNPFFLLEVVDSLLERGALVIREYDDESGTYSKVERSNSNQGSFDGLPSTLEKLFEDRIAELPSIERHCVDWIAIFGCPVSIVDLTRLVPDNPTEAIAHLCSRGLCDRRGDSIDFRHALARTVAYYIIPEQRRIRMHRTVGELLASSPTSHGLGAGVVGMHLARGEAPALAGEFYLEAGIAARNGNQSTLAVKYLQRALTCLPANDARRIATLDALESLFRILGRRKERVRYLQQLRREARVIGDSRSCTLAMLRTARFHQDEGKLELGLDESRSAAYLARAARLARFHLDSEALASEMLREMGDADGALAACDRALGSVDADTGDAALRRARAEVLHARGVLLRRVGRTREAIDAHASAIAIFRQTKAVRQEARSKGALAFALYTQNRLEDAISLSLEAIRIMVSLGARIHIAQPLSLIARCYGQLGDLPRARAYFDRALQTHDRAADREGHAETMIFRVEALIGHGAVKDAAEAFQKAAQHVHQGSSIYDRTLLDLVDAQWHLATGRLPEAVHLAETTRRSAEAQTIASVHLYALALESVARAELGEVHTATRLASTALGTLESLQGTEYGLEVRVLCARALQRSGSPEAAMAWTRAASFARAKLNSLRDARFRRMFAQRPLIQDLLTSTANASIRPS